MEYVKAIDIKMNEIEKLQSIINTIEVAIAEVEWNYPLDYAIAFEAAIVALKEKLEREKNLPLTLEELKQMGGEPVWLHIQQTDINCCAVIMEFTRSSVRFNGGQNAMLIDEYGKTWLAYSHKPTNQI